MLITLEAIRPREVPANEETESQSLSHSKTLRLFNKTLCFDFPPSSISWDEDW